MKKRMIPSNKVGQIIDQSVERIETTLPVAGDILFVFVQQTVRQQKYIHTQLFCHHILRNIVAHHHTFLCGVAEFRQPFSIST